VTDRATPTRLTVSQFAILDALYALDRPLTVDELGLRIHTLGLRRQQLESALLDMTRLGLAQYELVDDAVRFWQITFKGRAQVIVRDVQQVFASAAETVAPTAEMPAPVTVTVCNAQEPPAPAVAILHIDEAELNDWWATLDVDEKADVWAGHSLGFFTGNLRPQFKVPVTGTIGDGPCADGSTAVQE
jgi:hypothetical protein